MGKIFDIKNISKVYRSNSIETYALNSLSLEIYEGEFLVILGQSGAGKSTLLNVLSGIDKVDEGKIKFYGEEISNYNDNELTTYRKNNVGFVFQFYNLIQSLSVEENLKILQKICDETLDSTEILSQVGLQNHLKKIPSKLSGGEQQRVSIARALYKKPNVLFCDEPTGALDSQTSEQVLNLIKDFNKKYNMTVILVTHNPLISKLGDRVIEMKDGKIFNISKNGESDKVDDLKW